MDCEGSSIQLSIARTVAACTCDLKRHRIVSPTLKSDISEFESLFCFFDFLDVLQGNGLRRVETERFFEREDEREEDAQSIASSVSDSEEVSSTKGVSLTELDKNCCVDCRAESIRRRSSIRADIKGKIRTSTLPGCHI